ncbi:pyridoxal-5'-phosphate-dependent protein subunit beta [Desulfuribacillus stibiiarsenatis]|uniref:Pyridoxal-5'-phosphate-dependent protein subunit beta n=1 Tax=Desulfuribacillus stibiiarsenatis TaxID=1390249 RepID=A0A1E5L2L0_9FIRM|nr:pyridoxal-phosphate dependent enzyme [Desulfuribacillus stibiiarsenatis]OEH84273.1 pyridoxal-5'-phosphate-dependent protein subunit beta [Desulfuribacillus stibiiarsenatis]
MTNNKVPFGPTYEEMLNPDTINPQIRQQAIQAAEQNELDPINLFNISWKDKEGQVRKVVLPKELTGVDANIVVMLGTYFPSGSHKVGPAYSTLIEGCVDGEILPGEHTILGPSTGNFGIGVSYICNLMGYDAIVIMPDNMSKERYERIQRYGAKLDLTPGTESDVILTLQRTYELKKDPKNRPLAQFELMPNYRFHRHVTGNSAIEAVKGIGNGRVACFTSAPGSAGTIAAGDQIKAVFPEAKIVALEPYECSTLANGGLGQHRIEGIGDKMCTLIHNVLTTDFVTLVKDDECVRGLQVVQERFKELTGLFGVSGLCNILGAIKMAKYLKLGPDDNVVTIATDGFDRYNSVLEELAERELEVTDNVLDRWYRDIFMEADTRHVYDFRGQDGKEQLFKQKEHDWLPFGYAQEYLDAMKSMEFWDSEYEKYKEYDEKIKEKRGK